MLFLKCSDKTMTFFEEKGIALGFEHFIINKTLAL